MDSRVADPFYQRLYRLFCWLSEGSKGLHPSQAAFLIHETHRLAGRPSTSTHLAFNGEEVSFRELLGLLENLFSDRQELEAAAEAVFDRYVGQIIRRGFVLHRRRLGGGCLSRSRAWRPAWISISPGSIELWKLDRNGRRGAKRTTRIDKETQIEPLSIDDDHFVCTVTTAGGHSFELAHCDEIASRLLVSDICLAISAGTRESLALHDRRMALRFHGKESDVESERRVCLEKEKHKLEKELEEERRALKDEEIVRGLATRMLEEERLKSEHMERVLQELQLKLHDRAGPEEIEADDEEDELAYDESAELREYADELEARQAEIDDVWKKEDFLIISTQSI